MKMSKMFFEMDPKPAEMQLINFEIPAHLDSVVITDKPGESLGINETKDVVLFAVLFANALMKTFADNKVSLTDLPHFFNVALKLPAALSGINKVPAEIKDVDENEIKELIQIIKDNLGLETDQAKVVLQKSLNLVYAVYDLVAAVTIK